LDRSFGGKAYKRLFWSPLRTYGQANVYNLLRKIGLSYQKTKGKYPEADPEKQEVFKDALKKKLCESPADTVLLYEDEFSLSNTATLNYLWAERGRVDRLLM